VAGCCEYGDEPSDSCATKLIIFMNLSIMTSKQGRYNFERLNVTVKEICQPFRIDI
jgi:hypothetical protein